MGQRAVTAPVVHFDRETHAYTLDGAPVVHITGMLKAAGYVDEEWFTEESRERGTLVHRLATDYDLGALPTPAALECPYKGWVLAHVAAMEAIRPTWAHVETAFISPQYRYGGRPDRVGRVFGAQAVLDLKTGAATKATPIQTALQAILVAPVLRLPAVNIVRFALHLKAAGRWTLVEHTDRHDFDRAYEIIQVCCR